MDPSSLRHLRPDRLPWHPHLDQSPMMMMMMQHSSGDPLAGLPQFATAFPAYASSSSQQHLDLAALNLISGSSSAAAQQTVVRRRSNAPDAAHERITCSTTYSELIQAASPPEQEEEDRKMMHPPSTAAGVSSPASSSTQLMWADGPACVQAPSAPANIKRTSSLPVPPQPTSTPKRPSSTSDHHPQPAHHKRHKPNLPETVPHAPDQDDAASSLSKLLKAQRSASNSLACAPAAKSGSPDHAKESLLQDLASKQNFIHVRARRGQATDSHSLAERVRREKISERMKYLQDLVPGCGKITGKAVMLDEIINYVQSLQRQVEFLSMKLAAAHPSKSDICSFESLLGKDQIIHQAPSANQINPFPAFSEATATMAKNDTFSSSMLYHQDHLHHQLQDHHHPSTMPMGSSCFPNTDANSLMGTLDAYKDCISQVSQGWDDELQSFLQMGFGESASVSLLGQQGSLCFPGEMKIEM